MRYVDRGYNSGEEHADNSGLAWGIILIILAALLLLLLGEVVLAIARANLSRQCLDAGGELVYGARFAPWEFWCSVALW